MDPETLKNDFNLTLTDLFRVQCKFYVYGSTKSDCMPCILFTPKNEWLLTTNHVRMFHFKKIKQEIIDKIIYW